MHKYVKNSIEIYPTFTILHPKLWVKFILRLQLTNIILEEEGVKVKHEINKIQNYPFEHIVENNQHIYLLVRGRSSWSTFGLHLVRGLKALSFPFFINMT